MADDDRMERDMSFSEALTVAKSDRLRIARKLWSTPEWFRDNDRTPGRWLVYVMVLDGQAFGVPLSPVALFDAPLGPVVLVKLLPLNGAAVVHVSSYETTLDEMLATDWVVVDESVVAAVVRNIELTVAV